MNKLTSTHLTTASTIIKHVFSIYVSEYLDFTSLTLISFTQFYAAVNASFYLIMTIRILYT